MAYKSRLDVNPYFCETCGCHVFSREAQPDTPSRSEPAADWWAVATGVISGRVDEQGNDGNEEIQDESVEFPYTRHINVGDTKDGGLSPFIQEVDGRKLGVHMHSGPDNLSDNDDDENGDPVPKPHDPGVEEGESPLQASCHCGKVRFHITRPNEASRSPRSSFPDLVVPYYTASPAIKNPDDEKWWLRPVDAEIPTKYLAGACACRSCRLISGFEIQTWAFVPKANIFFHVPAAVAPDDAEGTEMTQQATTSVVPLGILQSYESSPGVFREFCAVCGATVFWHDRWRPELIDVSVGLFQSLEGARAEDFLEWCAERVSFAEDVGNARYGQVERRARCLIESLEKGLGSIVVSSSEVGSL